MSRVATKPAGRRSKSAGTVAEARKRGINNGTLAEIAKIDPDKPLTDKQRAFVKLWAQGETILSAAVKAGYTDGGTYAYRMVHQPNILALYNEEKEAYERESGMTRQRVINGLLEGVEMAKWAEEPASVINGWKTIGQMCGYFAPVQVKHTMSVEGKILVERMEALSDKELMDLIAAQAGALSQGQPMPPLPAQESEDGEAQ
jgi:phage terminase small subunit